MAENVNGNAETVTWFAANLDVIIAGAEVIATIAVVFATIFGFIQFSKVRRVQRQEKSARIMSIYARDIIKHIGIINGFFDGNDEKIGTVINKIDKHMPLDFISGELDRLGVSSRDVSVYIEFIRGVTLKDMTGKTEDGRKIKYLDHLPAELKSRVSENDTLFTYILSILNELEWMSMEIESGAADDKYIYGSLHQNFLNFMHKVAILIHYMNRKSMPEENYYSYVTSLYCRWVRKEEANYNIVKRYYRIAQEKIGKRKI